MKTREVYGVIIHLYSISVQNYQPTFKLNKSISSIGLAFKEFTLKP